MKIGKNEYNEIVIVNSKDEVIAVICDNEVIEHNGYKVILKD